MHYLYSGTLCFLAGLYTALCFTQLSTYYSYALLAALLLFLLALRLGNSKAGLGVTLACFLLLGAGSGWRVGVSSAEQLAPYLGRQAVVVAAVDTASVYQNEKSSSGIVRVQSLEAGGTKLSYNGSLRVTLVDGSLPLTGEVRLRGTLVKLTSFRNPGGFDSDTYNRVQALGARLDKAQLVAVNNSVSWQQRLALWNLRLGERMQEVAGAELGKVLSSMVLGGSSRLDEEMRDVFAANGIAHLLSVSGTHLVFLTGLLLAVLRPLTLLWRKTLLLVILAFYAALCGLRPPVLRALLMSAVLVWSGSGAKRGRLLCLSAMTMLCCRPLWLLDIGFQLSFAAAAGLLTLLPACSKIFTQRLSAIVREALAVTLAAQLATLPLEIAYFHQFSLVAFISNPLLVPVLELAAQAALLGCLLPYGELFLQAAAFLLAQALQQAQWLAALPFSTLVIGEQPAPCIILYYAALAVWADFSWLQFFSYRERRLIIGTCLSLLAAVFIYGRFGSIPLTAYFLDVGQGDCTVIVTPERKIVVADTGGLRNYAVGSRVVASFLRSLGYNRIDILLLSHYDFDHVGGAKDLLRQLQAEQVLLPNERLTEETAKIQQAIVQQAQGSRLHIVRSGESFRLDEVTQLRIVDAPAEAVSGNEASTLAAVQSAQGSLLLTGDMGEQREENLQLTQAYTVLKAAHHGSRYSTGSDFLRQVQPRLTVLSCGEGNRYGHPHAEVLTRLREAGSSIARTDKDGCVKVVFDEKGIKWYSYVYNRQFF